MAKGNVAEDRCALPGRVSTGPATPETEPDLGLPELSAPVVLADPGGVYTPRKDKWWNVGREHRYGRTVDAPMDSDAVIGISEGRILIKRRAGGDRLPHPQGGRMPGAATPRVV